jgi:hypothetical protein
MKRTVRWFLAGLGAGSILLASLPDGWLRTASTVATWVLVIGLAVTLLNLAGLGWIFWRTVREDRRTAYLEQLDPVLRDIEERGL